jgi:hypothetical protein
MITRTRFVRNCIKRRKSLIERELLFAIGMSIVSSLLKRQRREEERLVGNLIDDGARELRKNADYRQSSSHLLSFSLHLQPKKKPPKMS